MPLRLPVALARPVMSPLPRPVASGSATALCLPHLRLPPPSPAAPGPHNQQQCMRTSRKANPLNTAHISTHFVHRRPPWPHLRLFHPLCSSCSELSQCPSSPRPPHLQAQAPAGPSTSPAHNPDPRKILRSSELSPPPCVCLTLWAEGGPPLLCVPSAPVQSLCAHSQGGGGSNATSPTLRSRDHLGRGRPPCSGSPEPSTG